MSHVTAALFSSTDEEQAHIASLDPSRRIRSIEVGICLQAQIVAEAPFISVAHLSSCGIIGWTVRMFDTRTFTSEPLSAPIVLQPQRHPQPKNLHHVAAKYAQQGCHGFGTVEGTEPKGNGDGKILGSDRSYSFLWSGSIRYLAGTEKTEEA
ncbi:YTM1_2 [Sanghuangporus sanghuang]